MAEELNQEVEDLKTQIQALVAKNRELLDEKKSTKSGAERLLAEAQEKIDEMRQDYETGKKEFNKQIAALTADRDKAVKAAELESAANHRLLVDNGLTDALTKAGVRKELLPAARALLKEQGIISVESEGDIRRAVAKLEDGKLASLEDYVTKTFAASDAGKAFIPASRDSGAGAAGSSFVPASQNMKIEAFNSLKPAEQSAFMKAGGKLDE